MMRPCQSCSLLRQRVALLEARLIEMAKFIRRRESQLEAPRRQLSNAQREQRRAAGRSRARYALRDELNRFV